MYGVKLARELGDKGYTVLLIHPGYVKTDMVRTAVSPAGLVSR